MLRLCLPEAHGAGEKEALRVWRVLWKRHRPFGVVLEDHVDDGAVHVRGLMMALLLADETFQRLVPAPCPPLLHHLANLLEAGEVRMPTPEEVAVANGDQGLHLLVAHIGWEGVDPHHEPATHLRGAIVNVFAERHRGNRLRSMFGEVEGPGLLEVACRAGCEILDAYPEWAKPEGREAHPRRPHVVGVTAEQGHRSGNYWLSRMFTYFPPRFAFTEPQRRILYLAQDGHTDAEIARLCNSTLDAIKKRWTGIYERVNDLLPGLLPESPVGGRGTEKRRALLNHLRERPEELRAYVPPRSASPSPREGTEASSESEPGAGASGTGE